jgi:hypothetical protein
MQQMNISLDIHTSSELRLVGKFLNELADHREGGANQLPLPLVAAPTVATANASAAQPESTDTPEPTAPTGPTPSVDKEGLPWDERIHSSSKALVADGTWRRRKAVHDSVYNSVIAELRARQGVAAAPAPVAPPVAPPVVAGPAPVTVPVAPPVAPPVVAAPVAPPVVAAPVAPPVVAAAPAPVAPPVAPVTQPAAAETIDWPRVCQAMQEAMMRGVDIQKLNAIANARGLPVLALGATRPDLHAALHADLQAAQP